MRLQVPPTDRCADAAVLGAVVGLRSMTPFAVLALHDRLPGPPALRWLAIAGGAGELVGDKLPGTPPRTAPPALAGRLACGALVGAIVAGPIGAAAATVTAGLASFAGQRVRSALGTATGLPDPVIAVGEDALAVGLAVATVRRLD
jgi:uncharacterized membrane protein